MYEVLNKDTTKFEFSSLIDSGKALLWLKKATWRKLFNVFFTF